MIKARLTINVTVEGEAEFKEEVRAQLDYCVKHLANEGLLSPFALEIETWDHQVEILETK